MAMEQFEKWYNENERYNHSSCEKDAWKAALECVRDKMLPNCHEPMDIYDFIEEELSDD